MDSVQCQPERRADEADEHPVALHFAKGDDCYLESYSDMALRRVRAAERLSWWLTKLSRIFPDDDAFETRIKLDEFEYLHWWKHAEGRACISCAPAFRP